MTLSSTGMCTMLLVLFATVARTIATANSRELKHTELKEEFNDDFEDERVIPAITELKRNFHFKLEHQLVAGTPFTPRGVVEIEVSASFPQYKVLFPVLPTLSVDDSEKLEAQLKHEKYYTVRAKSDPLDAGSPYVMTSVPMCMLAAVRLREDFAFHLSDDGKLLSIEYLTPYLDEDRCADFQTQSLRDVRFSPFGTVLKSQIGPIPPKNVVVKRDRAPQGVEPVKSEDSNEEVEEESQSFLRKYWYIILPIVILSLFGGDGGASPADPPAAPVTGGRRR